MRKVVTVLVVGMFVLGAIGVSPTLAEQRGVQKTKEAAVSFRLATTSETPGYQKMSLPGEGTLYVARQAILRSDEVLSVDTLKSRADSRLSLGLKTEASKRLTSVARKQAGQRVAVFVDGRVAGVATLGSNPGNGRATLSGLSSATADRLSRLLGGAVPGGSGTTLSAVAARNALAPGGTTTIDVFVSDISDFRTYEVSLVARGGNSGRLTFENLRVQTERPDFVFSGITEMIKAEDQIRARLGGVLFKGGVNVGSMGYLGTFTVRASPDASGAFQVNLKGDVSTLLGDSENNRIGYQTGPAAIITVGVAPRPVNDR